MNSLLEYEENVVLKNILVCLDQCKKIILRDWNNFTCDRGVWCTRTTREHVLIWCPFARLNDSEGMDKAGAFDGGWSSEGFTWTSVVPKEFWTKGEEDSFLFLCVNLTNMSSTLTLFNGFSEK